MKHNKILRRILFAVFVIVIASSPVFAALPSFFLSINHLKETKKRSFTINDDMFWKDEQPFRIIGGDLHYFRVVPQYWEDRLKRAKALGLNTIQTYVPWNLHEPKPGNYVFEGIADLVRFIKLCDKHGFLVMLRPGPYICGEWDLGGFPAWLLAIKPPLRLRSSDPAYLRFVDQWWNVLLPKISPLLYSQGGPIIMMQIENEFGSYGSDQAYLHHLVTSARNILGDCLILYTTDGGSRDVLRKGTIMGDAVFSAVDFSTGDDPWPIFNLQREFNSPGKSPPLSTEFYTGWLTHWGEKIASTGATFTAKALETILSQNGSVVLYMAHGGTNFGFYSGANTGDNATDFKPDLTSYDYDAPIRESGDVDNAKFSEIRITISKFSTSALPAVPPNNAKEGYGSIKMQNFGSLFYHLNNAISGTIVESEEPLSMEDVNQSFGLILYMTNYTQKQEVSILSVPEVHDKGKVFISCPGEHREMKHIYVGEIDRRLNRNLELPHVKCASNLALFILVENMGRVNYGPYIFDRKGILSSVLVNKEILYGWKIASLPLDNIEGVFNHVALLQTTQSTIAARSLATSTGNTSSDTVKEPSFYGGKFHVSTVRDTYVSFRGWGRGIAFVNNINIGRYWPSVGPQCNLYVPAPFMKLGENTLMVLELEYSASNSIVYSVDRPDFTCP